MGGKGPFKTCRLPNLRALWGCFFAFLRLFDVVLFAEAVEVRHRIGFVPARWRDKTGRSGLSA